jgi:hypothetical protein
VCIGSYSVCVSQLWYGLPGGCKWDVLHIYCIVEFSCFLCIPCYFKYKTWNFHIFPHWKIEVRLKFKELFTSLQTVDRVAWKEPNVNTFVVNHQATSSFTALTSRQPLPSNFQFSHCLTFLSFSVFGFLSVFTHGKTHYLRCCIQKKCYSVRWKDR